VGLAQIPAPVKLKAGATARPTETAASLEIGKDNSVGKMIVRAILSASCVAWGLRGILDASGLSDDVVMSGATVAAVVLAAFVAIEFFGKKLRTPK
jgi:uncharacterized membrane protein YcjF (UPF0283 family)